ncbi:LysM peptidoglycan-binding domain-containing protein [Kineosporia sp. A_224]|uniref:LysM peptidoglycan-binding domain-containing protein n=1 Tax=Kineosporia sp. A_224 TaxID=1962180 RepID=UPI000B4BA294|nr:LysM peptidoglycan-binding domain-containing protein [Kineosporia sp. A_224]
MSTYVLGTTAVRGTSAVARAATRPVAVPAGRPQARPDLRLVTAPAPAGRREVGTRPARLRLTRRGRAVVRLAMVLLGLLVTAVVVLGGGRVAHADESATPVPVAYHVVQPGESLWQIAGRVAPGVDRRDTVARIVELNALESGSLEAGRRIAVPVAG